MKMLRSTVPTSGSLPPVLSNGNILALPDSICSVAWNRILIPGTVLKMKSMSLLTGKGVWTVMSKPIPPWGKHLQHSNPPLSWTQTVKSGPGGCLPYWTRGRVPATLTGLCKAMWPLASRLNHFQTLSLFEKGINNPCPAHITGCLGRSNKTYLGALFKNIKHHTDSSGLIPTIKCRRHTITPLFHVKQALQNGETAVRAHPIHSLKSFLRE